MFSARSHFLHVPVLLEYEAYKKLQINAATDGLTGLYNRRLFDETCEKELNRAKRYNQPLAVVLFDLHRLKEVNDQYGHMKGDQVLQLAANNLRKTLRASDFAFRIGGDEFALLLPQTDPEQAATLCRRVRNNFEIEVAPLKMKVAVALDFGMSVYPRTPTRKKISSNLPTNGSMRSSIRRWRRARFRLKRRRRRAKHRRRHASRSAPARETPSAPRESLRETLREKIPPAASPPAGSPRPIDAAGAAKPKQPAQPRKWERVSLSGTKSYAILDGSQRTASVIDLSYGGVALLFETNGALPEEFSAVLHVPILPPLRVSLRKAYAVSAESGHVRMGCAFVA